MKKLFQSINPNGFIFENGFTISAKGVELCSEDPLFEQAEKFVGKALKVTDIPIAADTDKSPIQMPKQEDKEPVKPEQFVGRKKKNMFSAPTSAIHELTEDKVE